MANTNAKTNQNWEDLGQIPLYSTDNAEGRLVLSRNGDDGGIQLRVFTKNEGYDGPTKKGFVVAADRIEDLKDLVGLV